VIAGIWTYRLFIEERENHPHANVTEKISHLALTNDVNLIQVVVTVENSGHKLIGVPQAIVRIQQVLPIDGCAPPCIISELNDAVTNWETTNDRFTWPLLSSREALWDKATTRSIEPGEKDSIDFEFAVSSSIRAIRVYAFIPNDDSHNQGWSVSEFYSFPQTREKEPPK
jgi:hypothetical protein